MPFMSLPQVLQVPSLALHTALQGIADRTRSGATPGFWHGPLLALALLAAAALPVFALPILPLSDYVNHLARMHLLTVLGDTTQTNPFFAIEWEIIPNLVMDLVVPPLARVTGVYLAGQIFVLMIQALLVSGVMVVHRAIWGRHSLWPLATFPFLYNGVFELGLMNYLFGTGVALWGLAAWIVLRSRSPWLRAGASLAFVLLLFVCHLFAVGLYGLGILCFEMWRFGRGWTRPTPAVPVSAAVSASVRARSPALRPATPGWSDLWVFGIPFLPVLPLMLASPTMGLALDNSWDFTGKLDGVLFIVQNFHPVLDLTLGGIMLLALAWAVRQRRLSLHPVGVLLLVVGAAVFLAMPRVLFGSWGADLRLPVALLFMLLGFIRFETGNGFVRHAFLLFVAVLALARFASIHLVWQSMGTGFRAFQESFTAIAPGSTILVAQADEPVGTELLNQPFSHVPCLAIIERASLVSTAFSVKGKQILKVRPEYRDLVDPDDLDPPTVSEMLHVLEDPDAPVDRFWKHWPERYDYVYVLWTQKGHYAATERLELVYEGPRFQLYRVLRSA